MPIRFYPGSSVSLSNNDDGATVTDASANTAIDRAILLGGQALASAWGIGDGGGFFGYHEERTDHDNGREISIRWINGLKKIRFKQKNGRVQDHGVMVVDSAISSDGVSTPR